jgi:hypothetical protein
LLRNNFIEAAVYFNPHTKQANTFWKDESSPKRIKFSSACGYIDIARRHSYPQTFAYVKGDVLWCGYGPADLAEKMMEQPLKNIQEQIFLDDELLFMAIDCREQTIAVQTDAFNTASIFIGQQPDRCVLSSDFARTCTMLNPGSYQLDLECVAKFLLAQATYDRTFVKEIKILYDRKRFYSSTKSSKLWLPPDASMKDYHNNRIGDASLFPQVLEKTINDYWMRYVGDNIAGCQLSGGLDSAVVAGYLAATGRPTITATLTLPNIFRRTQAQKLQDFKKRFNTQSIVMPAHDYLDYPWLEVLQGQKSQPFYHYAASPYRTVHDDLYDALVQSGAQCVFSGIGGDELFEHVDHRRIMNNTMKSDERFIELPIFKPLVDYLDSLKKDEADEIKLPIPLKSHSTLIYSAMSGNDYLAHDLWYVSPLADPKLYSYMQTLPLHYSADKLLLRIYANARQLPRSITLPDVNEDFTHVIVEDFHRLKEIIWYMLENSILLKNNMLDKKSLLGLYQKLLRDPSMDDFDSALIFNRILYTELNLMSLRLKF